MEAKTKKKIHATFFVKSKLAIDKGYYLEAMVLEYSYIEGRVNRIMELLKMPCGLIDNEDIYRDIGLNAKISCIQNFLQQNNEIFMKSKLNNSTMNKIKKWCNSRNERIHNLYKNIDNYEKLISKNMKLAQQGYEYAKLMSEESNRLKGLFKKNSDLLINNRLECSNGQEKELKPSCVEAIKWLKSN